jgi:uncharacterized protein YbaP (TraB family)
MEFARRRMVMPVHARVALALMLVAALGLSPAHAADRAPPAPAATRDAPWSRGLLFRLDKPGIPPSFVFGTLHSGDPRVTTLAKPVQDALGAARTFALEIHLSEGDIVDFFAAAQFDDGRRLGDFFDDATIAEIRVALGPTAPPEATLARLKPWAILLKLAEQPAARADGGETLDRVLLDVAERRKLAIVGLELPDEQIAAFDAIPLPSQVALVRFVLAHRDGLVRDHDAIVAAWQDRDLARIAALNAAPGRAHPEIAPHIAELVRHLVDDRSVQMAHRLFLPLRGGRVFVAVGALHLYGDRSLLALLRAQGYRVRRVHRGRRRAMA